MRLTILLRLLALGAAAGLAACGGTAPTQAGAGSEAAPPPRAMPIFIGAVAAGVVLVVLLLADGMVGAGRLLPQAAKLASAAKTKGRKKTVKRME